MNTNQIYKMLQEILRDYTGMGREKQAEDQAIIDLIMRMYYMTDWVDWEECQLLFAGYMDTGILDFPAAKEAKEEYMKLTLEDVQEV